MIPLLLLPVLLQMLVMCVITKDELVHARSCAPLESWLHAVLFVLHPLVFLAFGLIWWSSLGLWLVKTELLLTLGFGLYQFSYWTPWSPQCSKNPQKSAA
jgi:hypothetical protein